MLIKFSIIFSFYIIVTRVTSFMSSYIYAKVSEKLFANNRESLFKSLLSKNLEFFHKNSLSDINRVLMVDSGYIHTPLMYILGELLTSATMIIATWVILCNIDIKLALISFITVPVFIVVNKHFGKKLQYLIKESITSSDVLSKLYNNTFLSIKSIKLFSKEQDRCYRATNLSQKVYEINSKTEYFGYFSHEMISIFSRFNELFIIMLGSLSVKNNQLSIVV